MRSNGSSSRRLFVVGGAAAAAAVTFPRRSSAATHLKVLTTGSDAGALPLFAQENGYFTTAGLDVDIAMMTNGTISAAIAGDAAQVGFTNAGSVAAAYLRGLPFTIIADAALYTSKLPTTVLIVGLDSPLKEAKDLNGKKIAVSGLKLSGQAAAMTWIDKNGGDSSTVGFVGVGFSAMPALVESGRVDAAVIAEPSLSMARGKTRIFATPYDALGSEFSLVAYMAKADWVTKNRDVAAKYAAVMRQTAAWANANPQLVARILAKIEKLPESVTAAMTRATYPTTLTAAHLQPEIDAMAKYDFISKRVDAKEIMTVF